MEIELIYDDMLSEAKSRGQSVLRHVYDEHIYTIMEKERIGISNYNNYKSVMILDKGKILIVRFRKKLKVPSIAR